MNTDEEKRAQYLRRCVSLNSRLQPLQGIAYRFVKPRFYRSEDILSGEGGLHASGRWNTEGAFRISYTSLEPETALEESLAHVRHYHLPDSVALPRVLVSLRVNLQAVLDLRDGEIRKRLRLSRETMETCDWRGANHLRNESETQIWGRAFFEAGVEAVIVPSAANRHGTNLLLFSDNLRADSEVLVENEVQWV